MIRKFETKDTKQVMQIWLEGNIEAHDFIPRDYWVSHYPLVQEQLLQADIYVYEQDRKIQGFVGMTDDYLAGIFVAVNCRSAGIGKCLFEYVKEMYPVFSLHVYCRNTRAVSFYLREGLIVASEGADEDTGELEYTMSWEKEI